MCYQVNVVFVTCQYKKDRATNGSCRAVVDSGSENGEGGIVTALRPTKFDMFRHRF